MKRAIIRAITCSLFAAMPLSAQIDTTILRPAAGGGFVVDYVQQDMRSVFQALALAGEISISIAANVPQNQRITLRLPTPIQKDAILDLLQSLVTDNQLQMVQNTTTGVWNISRPMPAGRGNQPAAAAAASPTDLSVYVLNLRHLNNITLAQILNGVFSTTGRGAQNFNFLNQQGRQNQPQRGGGAGGARGGGGGGGGGGGRGGGNDDDELSALTSAVQSQLMLDPSSAVTALYDPEIIAQIIRDQTTPQDVRRINATLTELQQQGRGGGGRGGQAQQGPAAAAQAALGALQVLTGGAAAQQQQQQPVIVPTEGTNQIIVRATPADFALIQALVQTIDLRPLQVLIEVSIVEVTRSNDLNVGVSGEGNYTKAGDDDPRATAGLAVPTTFDNARDFVLELAGGRGTVDFNIAINALATRGDVTVASLPVIFAQNNRQAQLIVGEQRPFVANTSLIPNDNGIVNQVIQYRDVATTLLITPTINADGYVNMDVDQSIQNVTSEVQLDAPVISSRRAVTSLFVKSGQTAVIGGLTSNSKSKTRTGIPFLSRIPIIGALFGATRNSDLISEMYLFLTPHVVQTDQDTDRLTQAVKASSDLVKDVPLRQIIQPDPAIRVVIPPDTGSLTRIPQRVDTVGAGARGRTGGAATDTTGGRGGRAGRGGRGGVDTLLTPRGSFR